MFSFFTNFKSLFSQSSLYKSNSLLYSKPMSKDNIYIFSHINNINKIEPMRKYF